MIIHRILSWVLIIVIIAPLHIIMVTLKLFFNIFNQFHYYNFWNNVQVPQTIYEKYGHDTGADIMARILVIFLWSFKEFFKELKMLRSCKF